MFYHKWNQKWWITKTLIPQMLNSTKDMTLLSSNLTANSIPLLHATCKMYLALPAFAGGAKGEATHPVLPGHWTDVPVAERHRHTGHHEDVRATTQPVIHQTTHRCDHERVFLTGYASKYLKLRASYWNKKYIPNKYLVCTLFSI